MLNLKIHIEKYMPNLVRCKACGFVIREDKLGAVCPACGVPKTAFEPYKDKVSEKRKRILDMHIHPILVNFPVAFAVFIFLVSLIGLLFTETFASVVCTVPFLTLFLPFFAVLAIFSGILDGKTRFKKIKTPHLIKKVAFGTVFLLLSVLLAIGSYFLIGSPFWLIFVTSLSLACVLTGGYLGLIGGSLVESKLPN